MTNRRAVNRGVMLAVACGAGLEYDGDTSLRPDIHPVVVSIAVPNIRVQPFVRLRNHLPGVLSVRVRT